MPLRLVDDDLDVSLDIPVGFDAREAVGIQLQRCMTSGRNVSFEWRLATGLVEILDPDLQAPTASQVEFALRIVKRLGVSLPGEALRFRGSMSLFLNRHAATFRARHHVPSIPSIR